MNILVLGASGMIGNSMFRVLVEKKDFLVYGTIRSSADARFFDVTVSNRILSNIDIKNYDSIVRAFDIVHPDIVINCIGLTKSLVDAHDPFEAIACNSLFPHRLAKLCKRFGSKLIHISTDCVFSGDRGMYRERDNADARDLYGRTKLLGEIDSPDSVTLRTSTIGHELKGSHGLLEWFLSQKVSCNGFTHAIFSGLPTVVLAHIVRDIIIPRPDLCGLYHVASKSISKFDLLKLIADIYDKKIKVVPTRTLVLDRSLDATALAFETGYVAADWPEMVKLMYEFG
jgi:dTDP-4-dehydrorhamnose reductase